MVHATDAGTHDDGTLPLVRPWGPSNQDSGDPLRIVITYKVTANGPIPGSAVTAVNDAINTWESDIDTRESGWDFDLVSFTGSPPDKADINIKLKKGGGLVAGQVLRHFDRQGFIDGAKITISGSFLGTPSAAATITEITMHELGHALGLGHHNNENDLMGETVGHIDGSTITSISECDLDGFEEVHHWLTAEDRTATPHLNHVSSILC